MKLRLSALGMAAVVLAGCESMNGPVSGGSFDPLAPPGSGTMQASGSFGPSISPGQFVSATIDNTAFYKTRPRGEANADRLLSRGTQMKVISTSGNYVRVELDSGEVGFVPSVMVEAPDTTPGVVPVADGAYQVYPPIGGEGQIDPLPLLDPVGMPPDGEIPPVLEPDAPGPAPLPPGIEDEPEGAADADATPPPPPVEADGAATE